MIVGAGIGGLSAALSLAANGHAVTVLDRAAQVGGKLRRVTVEGAGIDAGPTVFTMRPVFEALFADAGARLDDHLTLRPATILARHAWADGTRLDLHADLDASAEAIGRLAGPREAAGFRAFSARAARIWATLEHSFVQAQRPGMLDLVARAGVRDLVGISPFDTLHRALGQHFRDPRLLQLFGRYATYCGSSPYEAPATLMLVAHVESRGVWLVEGGMHRLAAAMAELIEAHGGTIRRGAEVAAITVAGGRASGVVLAGGERIAADAVICNADSNAVASGLFGDAARRAVPATPRAARSLSALTWMVRARVSGFPLLRHNVFFSGDYAAEFADLRAGRLPADPTVYVCAQDRDADRDSDRNWADRPPHEATEGGRERLLVLVNAPPSGDADPPSPQETARCQARTLQRLRQCGLHLDLDSPGAIRTTPDQWETLYPATGGALYGPASHGAMASFRRPAARTALAGLYLAGGSVHPGPGVPMAAVSGRLAASALMADHASTGRFHPAAMSGGMSMR